MNKILLEVIKLLCILGAIASIIKGFPGVALYLLLGAGVATFVRLCSLFPKTILNLRVGALKALNPKVDVPVNPGEPGDVKIAAKRIGKRIKKARKKKHYTQDELAKSAGIARPNICRIERGKNNSSLETLTKIATALGIPITQFTENHSGK